MPSGTTFSRPVNAVPAGLTDETVSPPTPFPDGVFDDIGGVTVVPLTGGDVVVVVVPVVVVPAVVVVDVPAAVVVVVSVTVVDVDGQSVGE